MRTIGFTILVAMLLGFFLRGNAQQTKYYRHIMYNHFSPHVPITGIHEVETSKVGNDSHFVFNYDSEGRIAEIINNHYYTKRNHPLSTIGAYRTAFTYTDGKVTRQFFDKNDKRITNNREVYEEQFLIDEKGFVYELNFYDLEGKPMESNWNIAKYTWEKTKKWIIERRVNLNSEPQNISTYFEFGTTGLVYDKQGRPVANYNLDENLKVVEDKAGVASYRDKYDELGNRIQYAYHDKKGKLTNNQWGFARRTSKYDELGQEIHTTRYNENDSILNSYDIPLEAVIAEPVSSADSATIRTKSLGYLEALQNLDPEQMKDVMHKQLAKRTLGFNRELKEEEVRETTYDQMIGFAESWNKSGVRFPFNPKNEIVILDIYNRIASVKLVSDNWVEYLHLIKTNGDWKIIDLAWLHKDAYRYPRQ